MKKWILWALLFIPLCLFPLSTKVQATEPAASGSCGENLSWVLDEDGTLTISGTGDMDDYADPLFSAITEEAPPWSAYSALITRVVLEDGVTDIGTYAFSYSNLTELVLPNSLTALGQFAFYGCNNLTEVTIPGTIEQIASHAFAECQNLTTITIGTGVTSIELCAISYNPKLTDITFLGSAPSFMDWQYFSDRVTIHYPKDDPTWTAEILESYGLDVAWNPCDPFCDHSFDQGATTAPTCTKPGFTRYTCHCGYIHTDYNVQPTGHTIVSEKVDPTCTADGYYLDTCSVCNAVFKSEQLPPTGHNYVENKCTACGLEKPEWLVAEGRCGPDATWVLDKDGKLTISGTGHIHHYTVTYNADDRPWAAYRDDILEVVIENGITRIGTSAFENCANLTSITLPDSITVIKKAAFRNCSSLVELTLSRGLTTLEEAAFHSCRSLIEVTLPDSLTEMGDLVFAYCDNLIGITIPDNVSRLGRRAFYECKGLVWISMPDTIGGIDGETFAWCESMHHVLYRGSQTHVDTPYGAAIPNQYFRGATKHYGCTGGEITWTRTESTCNMPGSTQFTCKICSETIMCMLPLGAHAWIDATCTEPLTCEVCHTTIGQPLGGEHIWDQGVVIQEPVGAQLGVTKHTCTICGETKLEVIDPAVEVTDPSAKTLSGNTLFIIIIIATVLFIMGTAVLLSLR